MSQTQFAFLKKSNVPNKEALQTTIDKLGYDLKLDPEFTPFEDEGFSPCILNSKEEDDAGFEIFYEPATDVTEDNKEFATIAGDNDYCISLCWSGSSLDLACVMIVSLALAKDYGATISYEGDGTETIESLTQGAENSLSDIKKDS